MNIITIYKKLMSDLDIDSCSAAYVVSRLRNEGVGFATHTLPHLARCVLRGIEIGNFYAAMNELQFTAIARKGRSLRYFRSLLARIFTLNGDVLGRPDPLALYTIRTLCEYVYKLSLDFDDSMLSNQTEKFVTHDAGLDDRVDFSYVEKLRKSLESNYKELFDNTIHFGKVLKSFPIRPGSGTYSCAPRDWYNWKNTFRPRTKKVHSRHFSLINRVPFGTNVKDDKFGFSKLIPFLETEADVSFSELLFVPKDSRGPRTIVREPKTNLLVQLSFFDWFSNFLERKSHNRINFLNQEVNRDIARKASLSGGYSTLDLSSASDSVSYQVISKLFKNSPIINEFLTFRTQEVRLPDKRVIKLKKLAGMGSGFTFPMMAFLIHHCLTHRYSFVCGIPYSVASRYIYTYGDDICVPTWFAAEAIRTLSRVGLQVNILKSYYQGSFRESCGGDYLQGNDVTPPRLKLSSSSISCRGHKVYYDKLKKAEFVCELTAHCKELFEHGLVKLQRYFEKILEATTRTRLIPCSNLEFSGVVAYRYSTKGSSLDASQEHRVLTFAPKTKLPLNGRDYRTHLSKMSGLNPSESLMRILRNEDIPVTTRSIPRLLKLVTRKCTSSELKDISEF